MYSTCIHLPQRKTCMELNETTLDKEYETAFKAVTEGFEATGQHW